MSGTPIIRFNMIITVCTTFIIWQGLNPTKCVSLHPLTIMPKTASICIGSSIRRSGSSLSAVYGALISVLFMAERKPWVIKISHCRQGIPGNHIPAFYWQHCRQGSGRAISKNSKPRLNSGIRWAADWKKKLSASWRNTAIISGATAFPITPS